MTARFTTGSTMRHVVVMTATASVGLLALFFVDAVNLFYISLLGVTELAAAIGFAGTIQFFMISVSIGLLIAGTATVSRSVGAHDMDRARQYATSALLTSVLALSVISVVLWIFRADALALLGAEGEALRLGTHFLAITVPSMPLIGLGMICSGVLRAHGEATQAMYVTLGGGVVAAVLDPIFIFALDLGLTGAGIAIVLTRLCIASIGLWLVCVRHGMLAAPSLPSWLMDLPRLAAIAGPAMAAQLSTPFGVAYLTNTVAAHGDEAVAGWAVVSRIAALCFGGIFALSGAVGPIIGQNYGAKIWTRVVHTYRDALIFVVIYVLCAWGVLYLVSDLIIEGFGLTGAGRDVVLAFASVGAGAYVFTGALFVSNSAFNNLNRPLWSTGMNWSRDALAIPVLVFFFAEGMGTAAAVYIQAMGGLLVGCFAVIVGWRFTRRIGERAEPLQPVADAVPVPPLASGRAATIVTPEPLASGDNNR